MISLFIFSLVLFTAYLVYVVSKFGIPKSISESSYLLGLKSGNIWFYLWIMACVFPLMIYWFDISKSYQPLVFFACAGLGFVGATGRFRGSNMENTVHMVSAFICAIAASLWGIFTISYWWALVLLVMPLMYFIGKNVKGHYRYINQYNPSINYVCPSPSSEIFWVELGCFILCFISIFVAG